MTRLGTLAERQALAAKRAGVPLDQLQNFLRAGVVIQSRQLRASALARLCDEEDGPTEIGYGGARGGGKSFWALAQVAVDDCQRFPGLKVLLLRKVGKAVKEAFEDLRIKVLAHLPHEYARQAGVIVFPNGSRIIIGHFQNERDVDNYLGLEYDVIIVEEATTLSWQKYQAILTCNRSSKPGWRPRTYTTTNPGGIGHAWYKARFVKPYQNGTERYTRFVPATVDDNAFVNAEYQRTLNELTGWRLRAWRYGDWDIAAGQFFTNFRADIHVRPVEMQPHWRAWLSMDYGFVHWNTVYLMAEDGDGNLYHIDEHAERRWLVPSHAEATEAMLARHRVEPHRLETFVAGHDCFAQRGNEEGTIAEQWEAALGIPLERANVNRINGAAEYLKRMGSAEQSLPARMFYSPRCARLIECIPSLEHDPHRPEDVLKQDTDDDGNGGDDFYDGSRYGVMVAAQSRGGYGHNPLDGYRG
jgi:phage terminase large subunit